MPVASIPGRALLLVSGVEAQHFLQNIVTADIDGLAPDEARACALLSPQGKILFDFLVSPAGAEAFRLDCRADLASDLAKRLTLYRLRAKVAIAVEPAADVYSGWGTAPDERHPADALRDTRFPDEADVFRFYGPVPDETDAAEWDALRVRYGVAESGIDFAPGDAFPHDVLLDQNGGVGFRKGCFVGQEVVSRMQHRGTARRRILVARADEALPPTGTELVANGRALGTLGTVAGRAGLALARIDRVADATAAGIPVEAGHVPVTLAIPPGMRFAFPAPSGEPASAE